MSGLPIRESYNKVGRGGDYKEMSSLIKESTDPKKSLSISNWKDPNKFTPRQIITKLIN